MLIQTICHCRCSRLIEQAQHAQSSQSCGVLGRLTLRIIEISRHRDHRADQFAPQGSFGPLAQHLENIGGHLDRAFRPLHGVDERHMRLAFDKAIRQLLT
ncbi:NAD-specific glutamate dehydrogenase [compost metagenome]